MQLKRRIGWVCLIWLGLGSVAGAESAPGLIPAGDTLNAVVSQQPGEAGNTLAGQAQVEIPALCYHRFGSYAENDEYFVSAEEFKEQLEIIQAEGFTPINSSTLLAAWQNGGALPAKPVLITVDDGYRDFIKNAQPLLAAKGYPATLFVYTQFVNSKYGLKESDLKSLQAAGFEIGSHSTTHPKLTKSPPGETPEACQARLAAELSESRKQLQTWSGGDVTALAYPYGLWDKTVAAAAQAAGYQMMYTVNPGTNTLTTPRWALKRVLILHGTKPATFRSQLHVRELQIAGMKPGLGEKIIGPLEQIEITLSPDCLSKIDTASLHAKRGSNPIAVRYDAESGKAVISFQPVWRRGADLVVLYARDPGRRVRYEESFLLIVNPAVAAKGTN